MLTYRRCRLVHFNVTKHPTAEWTARQLIEACGLEGSPPPSDSGPGSGLWRTIFASGEDIGHPGSGNRASLAVEKRKCRAFGGCGSARPALVAATGADR